MQSRADSTSVTYTKLPSYFQPRDDSVVGYAPDHVGYAPDPVSYTKALATLPPRSTHHGPHLGEYGITPSPSDSNTSSQDEACKEVLFRPVDFERFSAGSHSTSVPPTPSDSGESSDRGSPTEDIPDVLLVRIPRKSPVLAPAVENKCASKIPDKDVPPPLRHDGITVNLLDREMWKMFKSVGNEMIVTKPGR